MISGRRGLHPLGPSTNRPLQPDQTQSSSFQALLYFHVRGAGPRVCCSRLCYGGPVSFFFIAVYGVGEGDGTRACMSSAPGTIDGTDFSLSTPPPRLHPDQQQLMKVD